MFMKTLTREDVLEMEEIRELSVMELRKVLDENLHFDDFQSLLEDFTDVRPPENEREALNALITLAEIRVGIHDNAPATKLAKSLKAHWGQ